MSRDRPRSTMAFVLWISVLQLLWLALLGIDGAIPPGETYAVHRHSADSSSTLFASQSPPNLTLPHTAQNHPSKWPLGMCIHPATSIFSPSAAPILDLVPDGARECVCVCVLERAIPRGIEPFLTPGIFQAMRMSCGARRARVLARARCQMASPAQGQAASLYLSAQSRGGGLRSASCPEVVGRGNLTLDCSPRPRIAFHQCVDTRSGRAVASPRPYGDKVGDSVKEELLAQRFVQAACPKVCGPRDVLSHSGVFAFDSPPVIAWLWCTCRCDRRTRERRGDDTHGPFRHTF